MEPEGYKKFLKGEIRKRIIDLQEAGVKTSKGEPMSQAAIGRTLDPPVTGVSVHLVIAGKSESRRIKAAIERELGQAYWIRKEAA